MSPEPFQRKAAEIVSDDESWRDGLEDGVASPLLDWALRQTDDCLARAAQSDDATPEALDECAYAAADQARALLTALAPRAGRAARSRGLDEHTDGDDVTPLLGPPLFPDAAQGRAAVDEAMAAASGDTSDA